MKRRKSESLGVEGLSPLRARVVAELLALVKQDGLPVGSRLVESDLAERLGVSRTPVAFALGFLEDAGLATHDLNKGYFLAVASKALPTPEGGKAGERLYELVADDRIGGRLPDEITEAELMRRYAVPRTKLLAVLSRIRAEGWIERQMGHGWRFLPLIDTAKAYAESYAFRATIEPAGLLLPDFKADPEELARLRILQTAIRDGGYRAMSAAELFEANIGFHETLASWSGNRFIAEALARVDSLRRLVEYRQARKDRIPRRGQAEEHLAILAAIEKGDMKAAARLLAAHLEGASEEKAKPRR
ncbi:MAG TPA: GntR family transcriptional regulator [Rectinemataceae bacterium]|nr:GntR family transcriptional regulator [Rectinemataceae bacterium]